MSRLPLTYPVPYTKVHDAFPQTSAPLPLHLGAITLDLGAITLDLGSILIRSVLLPYISDVGSLTIDLDIIPMKLILNT